MKSKKFSIGKEDWASALRVFLYNLLAFALIVPTIEVWPSDGHGWLLLLYPIIAPVIRLIMGWLQTSEGGIKTIIKKEKESDELSPLREP